MLPTGGSPQKVTDTNFNFTSTTTTTTTTIAIIPTSLALFSSLSLSVAPYEHGRPDCPSFLSQIMIPSASALLTLPVLPPVLPHTLLLLRHS